MGTHLGEIWDLPATGNRIAFEFIDIFRIKDGQLDRALDVDGPRRRSAVKCDPVSMENAMEDPILLEWFETPVGVPNTPIGHGVASEVASQ